MAEVVLQKHYITSGIMDGVHVTGNYIFVIADGSTLFHRVYTDSEGVNLVATPSGGPVLNSEISVSSGTFNNAQYCDGSDLVYYQPQDDWPYANYNVSIDHPSCTVVVCDLDITGTTVTNESSAGAEDGQVALTSTSSNGTVKYSLIEDFNYTTQGQASPITGLGTGNYTIYAKDAAGCTDQVIVFVGQDFSYGVRWRCDYDTVGYETNEPQFYSRIDIEERDYAGSVNEVCSGETPFVLEYHPSKESQIVPSEAIIQLLVEVEDQFADIRNGNDRQFRIKKYKGADVGSLALEWTGFISAEFYTEPYLFEPYVITFRAVDGLGRLKNKDFVALSGEDYFGDMSLIQIISECLKKLPLDINIRSCVNIFEENHNTTAADDPLAQTYIASGRYRGMNCDEVITDIIKPFTRAELFQSYGVYWIRTKEQSVYSTLPYREFDVEGQYVSNSTFSARKNLIYPSQSNGFFWTGTSQDVGHSRPYGKFIITHDLDKDNNMIDSGGFEEVDIDPSNNFFRDWNIFPAQLNVTYGLEKIENGDSKGAFFFQWAGTSGAQADNILASNKLPITWPSFSSASTKINIKFQVYVSRLQEVKWTRIGVRLRWEYPSSGDFSDSKLRTNPGQLNTVNVENIEDFYIDQFNAWKTIEAIGITPHTQPGVFPVSFPSVSTLQISLYFHNHTERDYSGTTTGGSAFISLKGATTLNTLPEGKRIYYGDTTDNDTLAYELQKNTDAESHPDIVRPDDYNAISNPYQWILTDRYNPDKDVPLVDRIMIDNVKISIYSVGIIAGQPGFVLVDPPETVDYESDITSLNESVFKTKVSNGDAFEIVGTEYIYNGYFKLSDGTVTSRWARSGVSESARLLSIYLGHLAAQGKQSLRLLSGDGIADIQLGYINSLKDNRDNRLYRFTRFSLEDKRGIYSIEMEETLTGADGESPPEQEQFSGAFSTDYGTGYD